MTAVEQFVDMVQHSNNIHGKRHSRFPQCRRPV